MIAHTIPWPLRWLRLVHWHDAHHAHEPAPIPIRSAAERILAELTAEHHRLRDINDRLAALLHNQLTA